MIISALARPIFTIGHSKHDAPLFAQMLESHGVTHLADVRSTPGSRRHPQFDRGELAGFLGRRGLRYTFFGDELGGRPSDGRLYVNGQVDYAAFSESAGFQRGLERLKSMSVGRTIALLCAEADPMTCHRGILIARCLVDSGADVRHILADGDVEAHESMEDRLLTTLRLGEDLFAARDAVLTRAYAMQAARIAFRKYPARNSELAG